MPRLQSSFTYRSSFSRAVMSETRSTIEIGWVIAGQLEEADYEAVKSARAQLLDVLNQWFSEFSWRMPLVRRPEMVNAVRVEPVTLLDSGYDELASYHWDLSIVITQADFVTHYKPFALAIVSRGLDVGLISTSRIDPASVDENLPRDERVHCMGGRIQSLALHILGHLGGLRHDTDTTNIMRDLREVAELDDMNGIHDRQRETLERSLRQVADTRLEEEANNKLRSTAAFYLRSAWRNRHEIYEAVRQARPWEFPKRLAKLTIAAVSAGVVLMMTAEAWDFAYAQSGTRTTVLALIALLATTVYVAGRQQLFQRRKRHQLSEQTVITNVAISLIVLCGMTTTLVSMFVCLLLSSKLLFAPELIDSWAQSEEVVTWSHYLRFSGIAAALALVIGALGASFEDQHHFRHITLVDEET